jgi:hypothetical protein
VWFPATGQKPALSAAGKKPADWREKPRNSAFYNVQPTRTIADTNVVLDPDARPDDRSQETLWS